MHSTNPTLTPDSNPSLQSPSTPRISFTPPTALKQPPPNTVFLAPTRAFKPIATDGVYIEGRESGLSTPGSVYRFANLIVPDQLPPVPLRDIPRRFKDINRMLDTVRRTLWTAFATACETRTVQCPVSRRIAFALGEASLPGTPIEATTEQWIRTQESLLSQAKSDLSELECILLQYIDARRFVAAHGHFDDTVPLCGQAHIDALVEKLEKVAFERIQAESMRRELDVYRAEKKAIRHLGWEAIQRWQATRAARGVTFGLPAGEVQANA